MLGGRVVQAGSMNERSDSFFTGVAVGAAIGGIVGGLIGVVVGSRYVQPRLEASASGNELPGQETNSAVLRDPSSREQRRVEVARRGLEDKIAQLNEAIDAVRDQLSNSSSPAADNGGYHEGKAD